MPSLQPSTPPALVDIWPLIADNYSSCSLHVTDHGQAVDISAIPQPMFLSDGANSRGPSYTSAWVITLTSVTCCLNILTFSTSEPSSLNIHGFRGQWGYLHELYPKTYVIVTQNAEQESWFRFSLLKRLPLPQLPEIFVVRPGKASGDIKHDLQDKVLLLVL